MRNPARVLWTEGMLISPQHLQQQDLYHERRVATRLAAIDPLFWGVLRVTLAPSALQARSIVVEALEAILPDGTALMLERGDSELPPSRPVEGHFSAADTSLDVYIALSLERAGVPSAGSQKGQATRFVRSERSVADLQAEAEPREVAFASRNPVVLFGDETRDDYVCIKIAEIVRDDANELMVSEPYIAPCLRIAASPFLMSGLGRIFTTMRTRRAALKETQRERDGSSVEYNATDVTRFLLVNAINTYLPVIRHLSETGDVHPRTAYLTLTQLAGQLSSFSSTVDPVDLIPFEYTNLRASFEGLFACILSLLHATLQKSFVSVDLDGRQDGMHLGQLEDPQWGACRDFFLAITSTSVPEQDIGRQVPRLSKVASWQEINSILTAASPGAATQVVYQPPSQLPVRAGTTYFQVNTENEFWRNAAQQKQIAVYLPRPFDATQTQVRLLGIIR